MNQGPPFSHFFGSERASAGKNIVTCVANHVSLHAAVVFGRSGSPSSSSYPDFLGGFTSRSSLIMARALLRHDVNL